jgi:predicted phage terminase large subunit-like protein
MEHQTNLKPKSLNEEEERILEQMLHNRSFRLAMVRKSHFWFFHYYFRDYIKYRTADFQKDIFALTENPLFQNILITAFRGSGKSTLITLSYVIWAILGEQQKKYVIILGQTHSKSQIHLAAIKYVFETNPLLRQDLGPFKEENNQWGALSLILPQYGAKISTGSVEQSIRGVRHNQHRPDLIICDDLEDMDSVRTQENRDRLFNWVTGDVLPAGDINTRIVFIGTPLHEDSLLRRLERIFESGSNRSVVRRYPILDVNGNSLWAGKFATPEDVQAERDKCLNELSWQREYMLRIVQSETQIIKREHIQYYKELPKMGHRRTILMIDPARSLKLTADYTAMVAAHIYGSGKDRRIYIAPHPVNARLTSQQFIEKVRAVTNSLKTQGHYCYVYVEDVGFQGVLTDLLVRESISAKGYSIRGQTKEGRVESVAPWVELGKVLFFETGCEHLIQQILGFGVERHDDLVDAFTMACLQLMEDSKIYPSITWIGGNPLPRPGTDDWMTTMRGWRPL